jgi:hypothetical protein
MIAGVCRVQRSACARAPARPRAVHVVCVLALCCWSTAALAQPLPRASRIEIAVGVGLFAGASVGDADADLRGNSQSSSTLRLFAADAQFEPAAALETRVAWRFTSRFAAEVHAMRVGQDLRVSVTADAEGAPAITVAERVDRYVVDAGLLVQLDELRVAGWVPFAVAGAGYLRQLHEGGTLVEEGHVYHAGAGVKRSVLVRRGRFLDGIGVRGDARVYVFSQALAGDDSPQPYLSVTGSVVFAF